MTMQEAMSARHTVRKYKDISLSAEMIEKLNERMEINNKTFGLSVKLMVNDSNAVGGMVRLLFAKGVKNYFILAGDEAEDFEEKLGYCGADLMLYAQTLGLNSWYIGGMFHHNVKQFTAGKTVIGVIAIGYGKTQGIPHRSKNMGEVSAYQGAQPAWFVKGVAASLLAPTALNKQDYFITGSGNKVQIRNDNGIFTGVNRGLIKYHFQLGAGQENFEWI